MEIRQALSNVNVYLNRVQKEYQSALRLKDSLATLEDLDVEERKLKDNVEKLKSERQDLIKALLELDIKLNNKIQEYEVGTSNALNNMNEEVKKAENEMDKILNDIQADIEKKRELKEDYFIKTDKEIKERAALINNLESRLEELRKELRPMMGG